MIKQERKYSKYETKTVDIRRVVKVTSGAKRLRFSAIVVTGDRQGLVGVGLGRGSDTRSAIEKGTNAAEKSMKKIQLIGDTIPHEVVMKLGASKMLLRPARPGTGIIAGPSARAVLELAGVENVYAKVLGTSNLVSNTYCTFEALKSVRNERVLNKMDKMKERIGLKVEMDKERKKKDLAKKKKQRMEDNKGKNDKRKNFQKKPFRNNISKDKKDATRTNTQEKK